MDTPKGMASVKESLDRIMNIKGAVGTAIVDYQSGVTLGTKGGDSMDMELAGAGNTRIILMVKEALNENGLDEPVEDVLVTLEGQYHLTRFSQEHADIFTYLILNRDASNLALARRQLAEIEREINVDKVSDSATL